jgi:hypothetical protein
VEAAFFLNADRAPHTMQTFLRSPSASAPGSEHEQSITEPSGQYNLQAHPNPAEFKPLYLYSVQPEKGI